MSALRKPAPLHRRHDSVDVVVGGRSMVCEVIDVENCYPSENWVWVAERGNSSNRWRMPEGDVGSPNNRELRA